MKVYKIELMVIDVRNLGFDKIQDMIELPKSVNQSYTPVKIISSKSREIDEEKISYLMGFDATRKRELDNIFNGDTNVSNRRLLTWNIGYRTMRQVNRKSSADN